MVDLPAKQAQRLATQARYWARHPDRVAASQERYLAKRKSKALKLRAKCKRYRAEHPEKVAAYKKGYRETHREFLAETQRLYRERHRARMAESKKRYQERYPDRVAECNKRYRERHRARLAEAQKRYREKHRAQLAKAQKRYRENNPERRLAYDQQYRETHRDLLREKERRRRARLVEKKRTREKLNALGPLKLTISLVDYLKSPSGHTPVTRYVKAFCDSLESADTNESPTESFVQLLEGDSRTLIDLDSGTMQVVEPPECDLDDLSFLQDLLKDMSPDDCSRSWAMSRSLPLMWRHCCPLKVSLICSRTCRPTRASI